MPLCRKGPGRVPPERVEALLEGAGPGVIAGAGEEDVLLQVPAVLGQVRGGERRRDRDRRGRPPAEVPLGGEGGVRPREERRYSGRLMCINGQGIKLEKRDGDRPRLPVQ